MLKKIEKKIEISVLYFNLIDRKVFCFRTLSEPFQYSQFDFIVFIECRTINVAYKNSSRVVSRIYPDKRLLFMFSKLFGFSHTPTQCFFSY